MTTAPPSDSGTPSPEALVKPMLAVIAMTGLAFAVAVPLSVLIGWLIDGSAGAWGALLGLLMPLVFFGITAVVALVTARAKPQVLGIAVLTTWLLKIVLLIAFLAAIDGRDFYNAAVLFAFLLGGTGVYLIAEAMIVTRTRVPYLDPVPSVPPPAAGTPRA